MAELKLMDKQTIEDFGDDNGFKNRSDIYFIDDLAELLDGEVASLEIIEENGKEILNIKVDLDGEDEEDSEPSEE